MAEDNVLNGEGDIGWWNCSLCTYKNSAEKFKCEICDLRRGTSTRKPRCSADTIVAQVVKQQEQIRQQTKVKTTPNKTKSGGHGSQQTAETSNVSDSIGTSASGHSRPPKKSVRSKKRNIPVSVSDDGSDDDVDINEDDYLIEATSDEELMQQRRDEAAARRKSDIKKSKRKKAAQNRPSTAKKPKKGKSTIAMTSANGDRNDSESDTSNATDELSASSSESMLQFEDDASDSSGTQSRMMSATPDSTRSSEPQLRMMSATPESLGSISDIEPRTSSPPPNHQSSTSYNGGAHPTKDNPFKIRPIELNGNLIKYLPPTSTGRTGLIIDKKRFTQHSVTVDDVTITFTEFATRQNNYVRKSKKRSGKAAANRSSTAPSSKIQPKIPTSNSNNNSPIPTTAKAPDRASITDADP